MGPRASPVRTPRRRPTTDAGAEADAAQERDEADAEGETGPLRRCLVTRERGERARMLRFVLTPDGQVVPDLLAKLPGRGMWLSARRDVLETARSRNAFARAARRPVVTAPNLTQVVEAGLTRRVCELLGLARRAGQANYGFERAREWLLAGRAGLVLQARDGSREERARFIGPRREVAVATPLSASQMGAVFGRDHIVHVVIAPGRLAETLKIDGDRLAGVAGVDGGVEQAE